MICGIFSWRKALWHTIRGLFIQFCTQHFHICVAIWVSLTTLLRYSCGKPRHTYETRHILLYSPGIKPWHTYETWRIPGIKPWHTLRGFYHSLWYWVLLLTILLLLLLHESCWSGLAFTHLIPSYSSAPKWHAAHGDCGMKGTGRSLLPRGPYPSLYLPQSILGLVHAEIWIHQVSGFILRLMCVF